MKRASFLVVLALIAVGAMALAGAGSAARHNSSGVTAAPNAASNFVGAGIVRQVGARNYAGPNCPGSGWNCTTATRVLQVATAGGTNSFVCSPSNVPVPAPTPQNCVIKQIGGSVNTARCTEQSSASNVAQVCDITQSGAANYAFVNQNISQTDSFPQIGKQTAIVNQGPASVTNQLQLSQAVNQSTKIGSVQTQNADQSANVEQTATGSGTNYSGLTQSQSQKEFARGTTQNQDLTSNLPDCNLNTTLTPGPTNPNGCAVVLQHSGSGKNENHLRQSINEDQNSTGQATQNQGSSNGGLDARVHQDTSGGTMVNDANQSKNQHQTAAPGTSTNQSQYDPVSCCGFASQEGGTGTESINQSSSLSASGDSSPSQSSYLIGTSHTPDGTCSVTQRASINIASTNNSDTESPCPFLTLVTSCTGGVEGGCTASPPDLSNPAPPPESQLTKNVRNVSNGENFDGPTTLALTGQTVEYRIVYSNVGTGTAHNVIVTDPIPAGLGSVVCDPDSPCTIDTEAGTITWDLGDVESDSSITLLFQAEVTQTGDGPINDIAHADDDEEPAGADSNQATVTVYHLT